MTPFEVTRIESRAGIYRITGRYDLSGKSLRVDFDSAAYMGTDGWVEFNPNSKEGKVRLQKLLPELLVHLEV